MAVITAIKSAFSAVKGAFSGNTKPSDEMPAIPTGGEQEIIGAVNKMIDNEINARSAYERLWFINIAAVLGQHWIQWNDFTRKFDEPKVPDWRVRLTINKILPIYRKTLAKVISYNPRFVVTPNSNEEDDMEAAGLGTKVISGLNYKLNLKQKKLTRSEWMLLCGSVLVHYYWDANAGKELPMPDQAIPAEGAEALPEQPVAPKTLNEGDLGYEVFNAYEVFPLGGTDLPSCQRLAIIRYVPVEELKKLYPDKADRLVAESDDSLTGQFARKIESLISTGTALSVGYKASEGRVFYKRLWERVTSEHPKGRYLAFANGVLLEDGETPDIDLGKEFEMPFAKYDDLSVPGRFWGQSTIEQMLPLNKELNKTRSQMIESRNLMSKPKWTAVQGTVGQNAITSEPGGIIEWNATIPGAQKPTMEAPPRLPSYVSEISSTLDKDISDIGRLHDVSFAQAPVGVTSGKAIRYLQEADDNEMLPMLQQHSESDITVYGALLKLVQAKYSEERMLKTVGENNTTSIISFRGADLKDNTDVIIEEGDLVSISRISRQEFILELFDKGILGNQQMDETRQRTIRMLQFGNVEDMWENAGLDSKQARAENKEMGNGQPVMVEFYDNHQVHLLEHLRVAKSPLFNKKPIKTQGAFMAHAKMHQDYMNPIEQQPMPGEVPNIRPQGGQNA